MRFHGADAVARSFENTLTQLQGGKLSPAVYDVHIHTTDTLAVLLREKKWSLILSKGGAVSVHEHHVSA